MKDYAGIFAQRDFVSLTFNVMTPEIVPHNHVFFKERPCYSAKIKGIDMDTLIKYICLFYDPKSPLRNKLSDHIERKKAAAELAGFEIQNEAFSPEVVDMMYCITPKSNECITEYLRGLMAPDWAFICAGWESYYKILEEIQGEATFLGTASGAKTTADIAKIRAALTGEANKMAADLTERQMAFLARDESPYLHKHLFSLIDKERKLPKITPERQLGIEALNA